MATTCQVGLAMSLSTQATVVGSIQAGRPKLAGTGVRSRRPVPSKATVTSIFPPPDTSRTYATRSPDGEIFGAKNTGVPLKFSSSVTGDVVQVDAAVEASNGVRTPASVDERIA